ncbi:hypothetical protein D0Y60_15015 [Shinella sp. WSJ-2]|nr:hypothetical protein D0Y60_15015 [Shinella sp. WSJ-2]
MKEFFINIVSDDAVEIVAPEGKKTGLRRSNICLCCERSDRPMDDDGCGICDACLGLPLRPVDSRDGLEFPPPSPHLSLTARNR